MPAASATWTRRSCWRARARPSRLRQPAAFTTIERAWDSGPQRRGEFSSLRSVQLIRTQLKPTLALGIPVTVEDERLGASGLAACAASGYTRHHHEISALLESTAS